MARKRIVGSRIGFYLLLIGIVLNLGTVKAQQPQHEPNLLLKSVTERAFEPASIQSSPLTLTNSSVISGTWNNEFGDSLATTGTITKLHLDVNNRLYVAGKFNYLNGQLFNGLAAWNGTTWQGYDLQPNDVDTINAMDSYQNQLVVAGRFRQFAGQPMNGLARWDGSQFQAFGTGISGINDSYRNNIVSQVYDIEVLSDTLYLGGNFDTFNGLDAHGTAYWRPAGFGEFGNFNGVISDLDAIPNAIFAGGSVSRVNQTAIQGLGLWNGTSWQNASLPGPNVARDQIGRIGTTLYTWSNDYDPRQTMIYRWNNNQWQAFGGWIEEFVVGVAQSNDLYAYTASDLWRLVGNQWQRVNLSMTINSINAVVGNANGLYLAGNFELDGSTVQLVHWNGTTLTPLASTSVYPRLDDLTGIQGQPIIKPNWPNVLKQWDGQAWQTSYALQGMANLFASTDDRAYLAYPYPYQTAGSLSSSLWQFDSTGALTAPLQLIGQATTWTLSGTELLANGITMINSQPVSGVVALNGTEWRELGLKTGFGKIYYANNRIYSLMITQNHDWWEIDIYTWNGSAWVDFTGLFVQSNGSMPQFVTWRNQLYFTNGNQLHRLENTGNSMVFEFDGAPLQLANINDRYLYVAGAFSKVGEQQLGSIVRWNGNSWQAPSQRPNGTVEHMAITENYLYLSGNFTHVGANPSLGVASFQLAAEPEPLPYQLFIPQVVK